MVSKLASLPLNAPLRVSHLTLKLTICSYVLQSIVVPTCVVYCVCTAVAPLVNWIFIFGLGLGLHGSAVAYNIISLLNCFGLLAIIYWNHRRLEGTGRETWHGW